MQSATNAAIEDAFNRGTILRTHVMRPTWHFVARDDIRWLLELTAPGVNVRCGSGYRMFELDDAVFKRSRKVFERALRGGKHLSRSELRGKLNESGVAANDTVRMGHILIRAELDRVVCSGPRVGRQLTYALFDERVPPMKPIDRDEALAKLTRLYFRSHGPATLQDFVWWSGFSTADAKRGLVFLEFHLLRFVGEKFGAAPEPLAAAVRGGTVRQLFERGLRIVGLGEGARVQGETLAHALQVGVRPMRFLECGDRVSGIAVPVVVERPRRRLDVVAIGPVVEAASK